MMTRIEHDTTRVGRDMMWIEHDTKAIEDDTTIDTMIGHDTIVNSKIEHDTIVDTTIDGDTATIERDMIGAITKIAHDTTSGRATDVTNAATSGIDVVVVATEIGEERGGLTAGIEGMIEVVRDKK